MTTALQDALIEIVADAGFVPLDDTSAWLGEANDTPTRKILATVHYFADRGWEAVRDEADGSLTWYRRHDGTLQIMNTTLVGVINTEARFDANERGLVWFTKAVAE